MIRLVLRGWYAIGMIAAAALLGLVPEFLDATPLVVVFDHRYVAVGVGVLVACADFLVCLIGLRYPLMMAPVRFCLMYAAPRAVVPRLQLSPS